MSDLHLIRSTFMLVNSYKTSLYYIHFIMIFVSKNLIPFRFENSFQLITEFQFFSIVVFFNIKPTTILR